MYPVRRVHQRLPHVQHGLGQRVLVHRLWLAHLLVRSPFARLPPPLDPLTFRLRSYDSYRYKAYCVNTCTSGMPASDSDISGADIPAEFLQRHTVGKNCFFGY